MKLKKNALGNCLKARERGRFIPVSCKHNSYLSWKSHYDRLLDHEKKGSSDTGQDDSEIMLSAFNIGLSVELHLHSKLDRNRSYFLTSAHRFSSLSRVLPPPFPFPFPFSLPPPLLSPFSPLPSLFSFSFLQSGVLSNKTVNEENFLDNSIQRASGMASWQGIFLSVSHVSLQEEKKKSIFPHWWNAFVVRMLPLSDKLCSAVGFLNFLIFLFKICG